VHAKSLYVHNHNEDEETNRLIIPC
jgi:hypothetical protein